MKLLLITPYIPYPLSEGGKISQYAITDSLRKFHQITLVLVARSTNDAENIKSLKILWPDVSIETINEIVDTKTNKLTRFKYLIKKLIKSNKKHVEVKKVSEFENHGSTNFSPPKSKKFVEEIEKIVSSTNFDLIQIDHDAFIDLVYLLPKNIRKIYVHHEIKFARLESALLNNQCSPFETYILNFVKSSEVNFLNQYNSIFVFSETDRQKLLLAGVKVNVHSTPFPVLDQYFIPVTDENTKIKKLVFIGGEEHAPNKDAVEWYINEIAPMVSKFSDIQLHVIGNWSKTTIQKYNKNKSLLFSGFIDDIISYCKNSIMIVPVRIGSGIRTKILYAMAQGIPIISASIGCEGIAVKDSESIVIANTATEFSKSINLLLNNPKLCYNLAIEAQLIAEKSYSQRAVTRLRNELYNSVEVQNK